MILIVPVGAFVYVPSLAATELQSVVMGHADSVMAQHCQTEHACTIAKPLLLLSERKEMRTKLFSSFKRSLTEVPPTSKHTHTITMISYRDTF